MKHNNFIGNKINSGSTCRVFHFKKNEVIKIYKSLFFIDKFFQKKAKSDYYLCKKYFSNFVVKTTFNSKNCFYETQKYISGIPLQKNHLKNIYIKQQFEEINQQLIQLKKDKHPPLDLIGFGGIFGYFSNILVDKQNNLHIIDTSLIEPQSFPKIQIIMGIPMFIAKKIQENLIQKILKK